MLVAAGQFAVTSVWEKNAEICASLMAQAAENDVDDNSDDSCSFNAGARMEYAGGTSGRKHRRPLCQTASL